MASGHDVKITCAANSVNVLDVFCSYYTVISAVS